MEEESIAVIHILIFMAAEPKVPRKWRFYQARNVILTGIMRHLFRKRLNQQYIPSMVGEEAEP